jgi:hypothetical protein
MAEIATIGVLHGIAQQPIDKEIQGRLVKVLSHNEVRLFALRTSPWKISGKKKFYAGADTKRHNCH